MQQFADLVTKLGTSTKTNDKLDALVDYFSVANDKDKVWVIAIFSGRRPKRAVNTTQLATYAVELINLPFWLFEESYHTVGDLAETITLLLPVSDRQDPGGLLDRLRRRARPCARRGRRKRLRGHHRAGCAGRSRHARVA